MSKRAIIILLAGLNLVLLASLFLTVYRPPAAYAQAVPAPQSLVMATAEIRDKENALYMLDLAARRMHVFITNRALNNRRMIYVGYRDLQRDFRGNR